MSHIFITISILANRINIINRFFSFIEVFILTKTLYTFENIYKKVCNTNHKDIKKRIRKK